MIIIFPSVNNREKVLHFSAIYPGSKKCFIHTCFIRESLMPTMGAVVTAQIPNYIGNSAQGVAMWPMGNNTQGRASGHMYI